MEELTRAFNSRPLRIILVTLIALIILLLFGAVFSFGSPIIGSAIGLLVITTVAVAIGMLCSRLHIRAQSGRFSVTLRFLGLPIIFREVEGISWHATAILNRSDEYSEPSLSTTYRVEVTNSEGDRRIILGQCLAWFYGVDCL